MFREISISKMQIKMQNKELDPMDVVNESITKYKKSDNKFKSFINFDEDVLIKKLRG
jgi:hypothetical protein